MKNYTYTIKFDSDVEMSQVAAAIQRLRPRNLSLSVADVPKPAISTIPIPDPRLTNPELKRHQF